MEELEMKRIEALLIGIFLVAFSGFFQGCVTDTASLKIEKSLPQSKLAYYNDSFDKLRTDLWEKVGYIFNKEQGANFKLAKMRIQDGKLWVQTETGCFSKGGLGSKYSLRGDFDIQVDCQIDFLEGIYDMDQWLNFCVFEKGEEVKTMDLVSLSLFKRGGRDFNTISSGVQKEGRFHNGDWYRRIGIFDGTLRIVRKGSKITTLYRTKGDKDWKTLETFWSTSNDLQVLFRLQNFTIKRTSITAKTPITATFDNFRINAAEEIIEEEI